MEWIKLQTTKITDQVKTNFILPIWIIISKKYFLNILFLLIDKIIINLMKIKNILLNKKLVCRNSKKNIILIINLLFK